MGSARSLTKLMPLKSKKLPKRTNLKKINAKRKLTRYNKQQRFLRSKCLPNLV